MLIVPTLKDKTMIRLAAVNATMQQVKKIGLFAVTVRINMNQEKMTMDFVQKIVAVILEDKLN